MANSPPMPSFVKELFALKKPQLSNVDGGQSKSKAKTWCLVYWINDKQVSIENIVSVRTDLRKEGTVSEIRFKDGKKYPGKLIKISGKS